jgi:hypothetical protein
MLHRDRSFEREFSHKPRHDSQFCWSRVWCTRSLAEAACALEIRANQRSPAAASLHRRETRQIRADTNGGALIPRSLARTAPMRARRARPRAPAWRHRRTARRRTGRARPRRRPAPCRVEPRRRRHGVGGPGDVKGRRRQMQPTCRRKPPTRPPSAPFGSVARDALPLPRVEVRSSIAVGRLHGVSF